MAPRQLYIHAGAHRTGTSSFQMCLYENRDALKGAGFDLAYPGRDGIPDGALGLRLPAPRHGMNLTRRFSRRVAQELDRHNPDPKRPLILSEENLPGRMIHFQSGKFYPAAEARFTALQKGFDDAKVNCLTFVLRPYADLYVSGFRKRAEDNLVDPFDAARQHFLNMDRGWPQIVQMMRDLLRPDRIVLIDYAKRGRSVDMLMQMVPQTVGLDLFEPARRANKSATDAALQALQTRYARGDTLDRTEWEAIIDQHADDDTDQGFANFTQDERDGLNDRYQSDLQSLQTLQNVTLLT